jgi:predicted acyl esterase
MVVLLSEHNPARSGFQRKDGLRRGTTTLDAGAPGREAAPDRYAYDPRDLRPGALEEHADPNYLTDQTAALSLAGDGVIYHSEPFAEATEISGWVKLGVWLSLDVPDTDFAVALYEVKANGGSVLLTSDLMRARNRHSTARDELVTPGAVERYDFDGFPWFSRRVAKGSRLRLVHLAQHHLPGEELQQRQRGGHRIRRRRAGGARDRVSRPGAPQRARAADRAMKGPHPSMRSTSLPWRPPVSPASWARAASANG